LDSLLSSLSCLSLSFSLSLSLSLSLSPLSHRVQVPVACGRGAATMTVRLVHRLPSSLGANYRQDETTWLGR
jgi:hypothetical protein